MAARKQTTGQQRERMPARTVEDEDYQPRHERVAGIDIAKASGMVCLRPPPADGNGKRSSKLWETGSTVTDIEDPAGELTAAGVEPISMDSTSDYRRTWFVIPEDAGLTVQPVNSSRARSLPGRPKTGKDDAQQIARLTEMGLLRPSFVPPQEIRALRRYTRRLVHLTRDRTRSRQRLAKLLKDAPGKMTSVISRLAGSVSARAMIEAMIAGTRPARPGGHGADPDQGQAARAGEGVHRDAVRATARGRRRVPAARDRLRRRRDHGPGAAGRRAPGVAPGRLGRRRRRHHRPGGRHRRRRRRAAAVARLDEIPGVSPQTAAGLIAEIGLDMSRFPAPEALVSRAGPAPVPVQSGPGKNRRKKGQGNTCARRLCTLAGTAAAGTDTFPGERHRRISARGGGRKKANVAVGRSILIIVWHLLKNPAARYADLGPDHHAKHAGTGRKVRGHIRQLEALGLDVVVTPRENAA